MQWLSPYDFWSYHIANKPSYPSDRAERGAVGRLETRLAIMARISIFGAPNFVIVDNSQWKEMKQDKSDVGEINCRRRQENKSWLL